MWIKRCALLVSCVIVAFSNASISHAVFSTDSNAYRTRNNITHWDPNDEGCVTEAGTGATGGSAGGVNPATIAEREKTAYTFFFNKGLTPVQAAAIVGNLLTESGGALDPAVKQGGGGPGRGIAQWTVNERWQDLLDFAGKQNPPANPITLGLQLDFLWHELQTTENGALVALKKETTLPAATKTFMEKFERPNSDPNINHIDRRINDAERILREYGGTVVVPGGGGAVVDACSEAGGAVGGGLGSAGGFTFPLVITKKGITGNKGGKWCYQSQSNCHHDYNAADIMSPTGTVVVAAKAGVVTTIKGGTGSHLTIKNTDNGEQYYYQHMLPGSLVVKDKQPITAGQPLGKVGRSADAMGTDPHLHFDILPNSYNSRPGCSGAACAGLPFINPQPLLIAAFNALPE